MLTNMALDSSRTSPQNPNQALLANAHRRPTPRRVLLRRRKLPVVRLGGKKPRQGLFLVRIFRRIRLRWLKLQYMCMLKKLKKYYSDVMKDIRDASATLESYQQRLFMESTFALPIMGISLSSYPSATGLDRSQSYKYFM